jgi:hypothetical protein
MPPALGHYTGTNPSVSFDVTGSGIENFRMTIPMDSGPCIVPAPLTYPVDIGSDGSFSYSYQAKQGVMSINEPNVISGVVNGGNVQGTYSVDVCVDGDFLSVYGQLFNGSWSASLNAQ